MSIARHPAYCIWLFKKGNALHGSLKSRFLRSLMYTRSPFKLLPTCAKPYFSRRKIRLVCFSNTVTYISSVPRSLHCQSVKPSAPSPILWWRYRSSILIVVILSRATLGSMVPSASLISSASAGLRLTKAPIPWSSSKTRAFLPSAAFAANHFTKPVLVEVPG